MSLRVLVVAEDPTLDQHILKPVVERIFEDLGRRAHVDFYEPPRGRARGVDQALDAAALAEILADRLMFRVFVLVVDRDCRLDREAVVRARAAEHGDTLVTCLAVEEVETWMLALHRGELDAPWSEVRAECHPKERFAVPFLKKRGWSLELGKGRRRAMRDLGAGWTGLLEVCPEIAQLESDLEVLLRMTD